MLRRSIQVSMKQEERMASIRAKRLQVEMTEDQYDELKKLANGDSIADVIRKALNTEAFIRKFPNAKVLIKKPDGSTVELVRT
jgi:hypothetical protein